MFLHDKEKRQHFEAVAFNYMDDLYRTALVMTRNPWDAEDLVQETYLRAYRFFNRFKKGTNFRAWILKILTNLYINEYRKKQKEPASIDLGMIMPYYEAEIPKLPYETAEKLASGNHKGIFDDELEEALDSVPEVYKRIVFLLDILEYSNKECSKMLGCPLGTVMSRHFRGRELLRKKLDGYARERSIKTSIVYYKNGCSL